MVYDKLPVTLLSLLSAEDPGSANAQLAMYLLGHADEAESLSVKSLAAACHVGVGSVSRFAREVGFESFAELRQAFVETQHSFESVEGSSIDDRTMALAQAVGRSIAQVSTGVDHAALVRLVTDLHSFRKVEVYGLLKAQAAALDLQVDLLSLGKPVGTRLLPVDQAQSISEAGSDTLVIVFSYTGTYFDAIDIEDDMHKATRPKVWVVCGDARPQPAFVSDRLLFSSDHSKLGHPYQLEFVAGLIAQEYAASLA